MHAILFNHAFFFTPRLVSILDDLQSYKITRVLRRFSEQAACSYVFVKHFFILLNESHILHYTNHNIMRF